MSYDDSLPTNRDWVRRLIGDTDTSAHVLSDNEVDAILTEQTATGTALKYYAAAACLATILSLRGLTGATGELERQVSKLRIRKGLDVSAADALRNRINELKAEGARRLQPAPYVMRSL